MLLNVVAPPTTRAPSTTTETVAMPHITRATTTSERRAARIVRQWINMG